jgi:hypothetical protein
VLVALLFLAAAAKALGAAIQPDLQAILGAVEAARVITQPAVPVGLVS